MTKERKVTKKTMGIMIFGLILSIVIIYLIMTFSNLGKYDYCTEWEGFFNGTLHRDSLLYTCYSLAASTFYCDYEILDKEEDEFIEEIQDDTKTIPKDSSNTLKNDSKESVSSKNNG